MRIAVVGSGHRGPRRRARLAREHEIERVRGRAAHSAATRTRTSVALDGRELAVDTGFIVFNERTYPGFCALLRRARRRVAAERHELLACAASAQRPRVQRHAASTTLFAQRREPAARRRSCGMLRDIAALPPRGARRCSAAARAEARRSASSSTSGATRALFVERYLVPMAAAIWSRAERRRRATSRRASWRASWPTTGCCRSTGAPQWLARARRLARATSRRWSRAFRARVHLATPVQTRRAPRERRRCSCSRAARGARSTTWCSPPQRPGAGAARRARRATSARSSAPPLPGERGRAAHRRARDAAPAQVLGELELPPRRARAARTCTVTLLDEPAAVARRADAGVRDAQPHAEAIDPARVLRACATTTRCSRPPAVAAQARRRRDPGPSLARGSAARTGASASTRTACGAASRWRAASRRCASRGGARVRSAIYDGRVGTRATRPRRARVPLPARSASTSTSTSCRALFDGRWLWSVERANLAQLPPPRLLRRSGAAARRRGARARRARKLGRRAGGPVPPASRTRAILGYAFNPVSSTTATRRTDDGSRRSSPRSRTRPGTSATPTCSTRASAAAAAIRARFAEALPRLALPCRWSTSTPGRSAQPGDELACTWTSFEAAQACVRRRPCGSSARPIDAGALARVLARSPG